MSLPLETITEGKYEILGKIAVGGVGSIYKVRHRLLDEIRVIKVLRRQHSQRKEVQRRFLQEAKTAIRLKHPNIAQIYDFAVAPDGTAYIVMEFIDGVGLDKVISTCGPPSLQLSLELAHQTLQAIGYLHSQRFVHRDLSPDNLMLTRAHDDTPLIKIIDLGIVKNLASDSQMTVAGMFLGKARYSSPEQFSAGGGESVSVDHRSDTYSFGVVLYELLTGVCPVQGETFNELAAGHLFRPPLEFEESDPEERVPPQIRQLVMKTLEKDPAARASIVELAQRLDDFRDPIQVSGNEFREIFVRAFGGMAEPETSPREGTTQGHMDQEFGIDRTTASGTTTGEVELEAGPPPPAAAASDARSEQISAEIPSEGAPSVPSGKFVAQMAEGSASLARRDDEGLAGLIRGGATPPGALRTGELGSELAGRDARERIPAPLPSEPAPTAAVAAPPRAAEAPAERGAIRRHWAIIGLIALFLAATAGGYFWLRQSPPTTQNTIRVERPPVFAGPPATGTTTAAQPEAEESPTP